MKEPVVRCSRKKAGQVSEGKVRWLHQQHELNETLSLNQNYLSNDNIET